MGDPRAAERTFQLLHQVAGRAGRETGRGLGFLQTHQPDHPVMRALIAGDREAFYATEIAAREHARYPPFGRLASLVISGPRPPRDRGLRPPPRRGRTGRGRPCGCWGPAEAPVAVIRGRPPVPPAGEGGTRLRPVRAICAGGLAPPRRPRAGVQAGGRCRSDELFVGGEIGRNRSPRC